MTALKFEKQVMICINFQTNVHFTSQGQGIVMNDRRTAQTTSEPKVIKCKFMAKLYLDHERQSYEEGKGSPCDLIISQHAFRDRRVPRWGCGG